MPILGVSLAEGHRRMVVREGESSRTAAALPPLSFGAPACGPLWRLFNAQALEPQVRRQARALCVRCGVADRCPGMSKEC